MTREKIAIIIQDIRFWIVLFFIVRMVGICNPPIETAHNWRQTTVTMVARNFVETNNNIFYPRIDIAGEKTGITGMEFPLLNYIIYLFSTVFGYEHWYGRLINLLISSLGIYFFYRLIKEFFSQKAAFYSSLFLLFSVWFSYSRKIMPDTFSVSLVLMGLFFAALFFLRKSRSIFFLLLFFFFALAGVLSKFPSVILLSPLGLFILNKDYCIKRKLALIFACTVICAIVLFWYFYWVPHLVAEYGFWHFFMGTGLIQGAVEIVSNLWIAISHFYDGAMKYSGFAVFICGLVYVFYKRMKLHLMVLLLFSVSFLFIMLKAGNTFVHHSYYIIPFVPAMAFICGTLLSELKLRNIAVLLMIIVGLENILNQQHDFFIKDKDIAIVNIESDLSKFSKQSDLIAINSAPYPTPMYFAHRKGWLVSNAELQNNSFTASLKERKCKYVIILKQSFGTETQMPLKKIIDNKHYCIYEL